MSESELVPFAAVGALILGCSVLWFISSFFMREDGDVHRTGSMVGLLIGGLMLFLALQHMENGRQETAGPSTCLFILI